MHRPKITLYLAFDDLETDAEYIDIFVLPTPQTRAGDELDTEIRKMTSSEFSPFKKAVAFPIGL